MKIFVSSTFGDLKEYRQAVREAIVGLGHLPVGMEDFGARPEEPKAGCLKEVKECSLA